MDPGELDAWLDKEASHQVQPEPTHAPKGWAPGITYNPETGAGEGVLPLKEAYQPGQDPRWAPLLQEAGFGDLLDVVAVAGARSWQQKAGGPYCHYVKVKVQHRDPLGALPDVAALTKRIAKHKPRKRPQKPRSPNRARVVPLADWQLGKPDGDGTEGTVDRILAMVETVRDMLKREKPGWLIACGMGDLIENVCGFYPMMEYGVELNLRDQCKLLRHLIVHATERWAPCVPRMTWAFVPGNHGEVRGRGAGSKAFTTFGDNHDLAVAEHAAAVFLKAPAYKHVQWLIPDEELTITLDVHGQVLGLAHAHQAARKGSARTQSASCQAKIVGWWRDMAMARKPIGCADVLITGHFHHLQVVELGSRTWVQCPSMDGGSKWFEEQGGASSKGGTVTFTMGEGGFGSLEVIR